MSDDQKFPSQLAERFQIRLPDGLRDRIRDAAVENNRSMNAEIVFRIEDSFEEEDFQTKFNSGGFNVINPGDPVLEQVYKRMPEGDLLAFMFHHTNIIRLITKALDDLRRTREKM